MTLLVIYSCSVRDIINGVVTKSTKSLFRQRSVGAVPKPGNDAVLVDVGVDVWCIDEDADSSSDCDGEEDVQLQAINHHCDVAPVFQHLHIIISLSVNQPKMTL